MKELRVIPNPRDDDNLHYNKDTGRYELTLAYLKDNFGESYKSDEVAKRRIKLNSQVCYYYINVHVASWNRAIVNFLLHRTEEGREFLKEFLAAQQYADLQTACNDVMFMPSINFNGQDKDRNAIKQNSVCVAAEDVFDNSDTYFGLRLGYQGQFPPYLYLYLKGAK